MNMECGALVRLRLYFICWHFITRQGLRPNSSRNFVDIALKIRGLSLSSVLVAIWMLGIRLLHTDSASHAPKECGLLLHLQTHARRCGRKASRDSKVRRVPGKWVYFDARKARKTASATLGPSTMKCARDLPRAPVPMMPYLRSWSPPMRSRACGQTLLSHVPGK